MSNVESRLIEAYYNFTTETSNCRRKKREKLDLKKTSLSNQPITGIVKSRAPGSRGTSLNESQINYSSLKANGPQWRRVYERKTRRETRRWRLRVRGQRVNISMNLRDAFFLLPRVSRSSWLARIKVKDREGKSEFLSLASSTTNAARFHVVFAKNDRWPWKTAKKRDTQDVNWKILSSDLRTDKLRPLSLDLHSSNGRLYLIG